MDERPRLEFVDPFSSVFANEMVDPFETLILDEEVMSLDAALRLSTEKAQPDLAEILKNEGQAYVNLVRSYGLDESVVTEIETHLSDQSQLHFHESPEVSNGVEVALSPDDETAVTEAYISPRTVRNFVVDAIHAIEPVGGDDEITFARDTGVKMAFTFALTNIMLDKLAQRWQGREQAPELVDLLSVGHEEMVGLPQDEYADFLMLRLAARLSADRLEQLTSDYYSPQDGQEITLQYTENRRRLMSSLRLGSYGELNKIDLATVMPLSREDTLVFFQNLPAVLRNPNGVHTV